MSLIIGLSKTGRKGEAKYRVVVREARSRRDGRPVATLGYFEKKVNSVAKNIDMKRLEEWQRKGAQLSEGVRKII